MGRNSPHKLGLTFGFLGVIYQNRGNMTDNSLPSFCWFGGAAWGSQSLNRTIVWGPGLLEGMDIKMKVAILPVCGAANLVVT